MPIIDDTNSALVYSGSWTYTPGPSEQEGGAVRSTTQVGASVRLRFRGTRVKLYVTVKANGGRVSCDINFDGSVTNAWRQPHYIDYYRDMWFDTHPIADGEHTITVTNAGTEGGHPFQFDFFEIDGTVIGAAPAPPPTTSSTSRTPRPAESTRFVTQTQVQTQIQTQTQQEAIVVRTSVSTIVRDGQTRLTTLSTTSMSTIPTSPATGSTGTGSSGTQQATTETSISTLPNGQATTVTAVKYLTSGPEPSGGVNPTSGSSQSDGVSIGLILGTILGGLAVLALALILFRLYRRRRHSEQIHPLRIDDGQQLPRLGQHRDQALVDGETSGQSSPFSRATSTMYTDHRQDGGYTDVGTVITEVLPPYQASGTRTSGRMSGFVVPFPSEKPLSSDEKESLL